MRTFCSANAEIVGLIYQEIRYTEQNLIPELSSVG